MAEYWFEIISWLGLVLCVGAFFIKEIFLLRLCTVAGTILMTVYYSYLEVEQGAIANIIVFGINLVYLYKEHKTKSKEKEKEKVQPLEVGALSS